MFSFLNHEQLCLFLDRKSLQECTVNIRVSECFILGPTLFPAYISYLSNVICNTDNIFFSIWVFSHDHSRITGLQGKGEGISLTPHYHFHPLHRHLDISRAITAESSPLHIASSRTRTGKLWFPSASR